MSARENADQPAFLSCDYTMACDSGGMSLRDYFAAAAIQAVVPLEIEAPTYNGSTYQGMAERAYLLADAMLAERAK